MNDLYARFGMGTDLKAEERKFRNKLGNLLKDGAFGAEILNDDKDDIIWRFNNYMGESHSNYYGSTTLMTDHILGAQAFNVYLYRLQVLINLLWSSRKRVANTLASLINVYFDEAMINLGYFVKIYKTKAPQILPASNKRQKKKIITAIDKLEAKSEKYSAVIEHFEAGVKELLTAKTKAQLKDVVEDMSTVCDSLAKVLFKDENLGFKHFFKDERWKRIKLNDAQKKIYSDLNQTIDQIKHDVIKTYTKEDVELIVYLTSAFIERVAT